MSTPTHPRATRMSTGDISVVNASGLHGRSAQTYLLRPGPVRFASLRVEVDEDLCLLRWSCSGAARTVAHIAAGTLFIAFPTGSALRVDGLPVEGEVVTLSLGESEHCTSTLQRSEWDGVVLTGPALEALLGGGGGLHDPLARRCRGRSAVMRGGAEASALRAVLRSALDAGAGALAGGGDAGAYPIGACFDAAIWRPTLIERLRAMLETVPSMQDLLAERAGRRRHALAREAERLIWQRVASPEPGGLTLDELCAELGTTRRTLQLAFRDHFETPVGVITRSARLQRVREDLGSGGAPAVSEAALRCGFEHLGRFAHYYRDFYGESPSATLRGQRQRSGAA
jgi:AraC-like DNA-binding protein